jgi:hypothetical protein
VEVDQAVAVRRQISDAAERALEPEGVPPEGHAAPEQGSAERIGAHAPLSYEQTVTAPSGSEGTNARSLATSNAG